MLMAIRMLLLDAPPLSYVRGAAGGDGSVPDAYGPASFKRDLRVARADTPIVSSLSRLGRGWSRLTAGRDGAEGDTPKSSSQMASAPEMLTLICSEKDRVSFYDL
uniref:Uncharacterized protein n=1 Tax=Calcidiscus leptoporus TaxID=127549 RepID=A0A7S0JE36_9EUKA